MDSRPSRFAQSDYELDGNETWLVLGGTPLHRSLCDHPAAIYFPILVMPLARIFRGVAFEFRYRDAEHRTSVITPSTTAPFLAPSRRAWCPARSFWAFRRKVGTLLAVVRLLHSAPAADWPCPHLRLQPPRRGWLILKAEGALHDCARNLSSDRNRGSEPTDAMGETRDRRVAVLVAQYRDFGGALDPRADGLLGAGRSTTAPKPRRSSARSYYF
jgi:hypothetical protein